MPPLDAPERTGLKDFPPELAHVANAPSRSVSRFAREASRQ